MNTSEHWLHVSVLFRDLFSPHIRLQDRILVTTLEHGMVRRHRDVWELAQGHTAHKCLSVEFRLSGSLTTASYLLVWKRHLVGNFQGEEGQSWRKIHVMVTTQHKSLIITTGEISTYI